MRDDEVPPIKASEADLPPTASGEVGLDDVPFGESGLRSTPVIALVLAVVPFGLSFASWSSEFVNGAVVRRTYFEPVGVFAGGAAALAGLVFLIGWLRGKARPRHALSGILALVALVLGAWHLTSGLGLWQDDGMASGDEGTFISIETSTPAETVEWRCNENDLEGCLVGCETDGHAPSCSIAAGIVMDVEDGASNLPRAIGLATKACDGGSGAGCANLGAALLRQELGDANVPAIVAAFRKACELGEVSRCGFALMHQAPGVAVLPPETRRALFDKGCHKEDALPCAAAAQRLRRVKLYDEARELAGWLCDAKVAEGCTQLGFVLSRPGASADENARARVAFQAGCDGDSRDGCWNLANLMSEDAEPDLIERERLYRKACNADNAKFCYENAIEIERDPAGQALVDKVTCDVGYDRACNNSGYRLLTSEKRTEDDVRVGLSLLEKACNSGNARACANRGSYHLGDFGGALDRTKALPWYERACLMSDVDGLDFLDLARRLLKLGHPMVGRRVVEILCEEKKVGEACAIVPLMTADQPDLKELETYSMRACDMGEWLGCMNLDALLTNKKYSVKPDWPRAQMTVERACDLGNGEGCARAALRLREGREGVPVDTAKADLLDKRACELGYADACPQADTPSDTPTPE